MRAGGLAPDIARTPSSSSHPPTPPSSAARLSSLPEVPRLPSKGSGRLQRLPAHQSFAFSSPLQGALDFTPHLPSQQATSEGWELRSLSSSFSGDRQSLEAQRGSSSGAGTPVGCPPDAAALHPLPPSAFAEAGPGGEEGHSTGGLQEGSASENAAACSTKAERGLSGPHSSGPSGECTCKHACSRLGKYPVGLVHLMKDLDWGGTKEEMLPPTMDTQALVQASVHHIRKVALLSGSRECQSGIVNHVNTITRAEGAQP